MFGKLAGVSSSCRASREGESQLLFCFAKVARGAPRARRLACFREAKVKESSFLAVVVVVAATAATSFVAEGGVEGEEGEAAVV